MILLEPNTVCLECAIAVSATVDITTEPFSAVIPEHKHFNPERGSQPSTTCRQSATSNIKNTLHNHNFNQTKP